jgi:hypothetical protein
MRAGESVEMPDFRMMTQPVVSTYKASISRTLISIYPRLLLLKMMFIKPFFWVLSFAFSAAGVPSPGPCSGACGTHDPALIKRVSDGTYFRFSTNGHVGVASAPSIAGPWTELGAALPGAVKLPEGTDIWVSAP